MKKPARLRVRNASHNQNESCTCHGEHCAGFKTGDLVVEYSSTESVRMGKGIYFFRLLNLRNLQHASVAAPSVDVEQYCWKHST